MEWLQIEYAVSYNFKLTNGIMSKLNSEVFIMKTTNKIFVIALLISLMFSISAVAAQEDVTFNQTNLCETPNVNFDADDDINPSSSSSLGAGLNEKDTTLSGNSKVSGDTFEDIQSVIDKANAGDTIYLEGKNYT